MSAFRPATRQGIKPLIGLFGKSGGGKTLSALLLARGIAGPSGKVGLIDTENKRGSLFVDLVPGGYLTHDLNPPFAPDAYSEAINTAEAEGIDCLVIDSFSHEWMGEGGYLEMKEAVLDKMAGDDWKKREKCALAAAARCKPSHNRLIAQLLRSRMAIILCFRGKEKVKLEKQDNKTAVVSDDYASPIQDSDVIFEMLVAGEVYSIDGVGGFFRCTKHTHPSILPLLPKFNAEQISVTHGEALAKWANHGGAAPTARPAMDAEAERLMREVWDETATEHGGEKARFRALLIGNGLVEKGIKLNELSADQWNKILSTIRDLKASAE